MSGVLAMFVSYEKKASARRPMHGVIRGCWPPRRRLDFRVKTIGDRDIDGPHPRMTGQRTRRKALYRPVAQCRRQHFVAGFPCESRPFGVMPADQNRALRFGRMGIFVSLPLPHLNMRLDGGGFLVEGFAPNS